MTVNKKITDGLIKHQMQNIRLSKSEARKSLKVFKEYDKEFLSQLRNLKTVKQKKDFNVLMKEIRRINNNLFDDLLEYTKSNLNDIYRDELIFIHSLYNKAIKSEFPKTSFETNLPKDKDLYIDEIIIGDKATVIGKKLIVDGQSIASLIDSLKDINYKKIEQKMEYAFSTQELNTIEDDILLKDDKKDKSSILGRAENQFYNIYISSFMALTDYAHNDFTQENEDIVSYGIYVATLDSNTTPICMSLHGNRYAIDDGPRPPQHYNCRSQFILEMDLDEKLSDVYPYNIIKEKMGQVVVYKNFGEFLKNQNKEFIEDVLGITRAKLFINNELPLKKYIDANDNRFFTLDEMKKKNKQIFDSLD